jgi:hypothetical protein
MEYEELKKVILSMPLGERKTVYKIDDSTELFINKPLEIPAKLKRKERYDPLKNIQIGISKKGIKEFLPNHLRILIDLNIKNREDQEKSKLLFDAIEEIYEGEDPEKFRKILISLEFKDEIENSLTDLCLTQLFMLEQDINYDFGGVQPPRAYLMGYIRMIRLKTEEIDKLLWSSTRHPPRKEFRSKECLNQ